MYRELMADEKGMYLIRKRVQSVPSDADAMGRIRRSSRLSWAKRSLEKGGAACINPTRTVAQVIAFEDNPVIDWSDPPAPRGGLEGRGSRRGWMQVGWGGPDWCRRSATSW